ncbi:FxSxx-COOH system tetratricopeptide repeat protein [Streptomyces sp. NPDC005408]|uniref:FxSxx-COOH system tetratricopeptide repeat protein n=1 Tax=Streptomyces sp. NPDC005408 TaxID=3155341 RepID=UPI00339F7246
MTPSSDGRGSVVTFYSFKGGVGRTMAVANVAWIMASRGLRVLAVDWDLEAPGLQSYFHPLLTDPELRDTDGLINMLRAYQEAVLLPGQESPPQDDSWFQNTVSLDPYVVGLGLHFEEGGRLDFLPAGRQNAVYSDAVTSFNWHHFYERLGGGIFLQSLREEMIRRYDYVLVDSRTGVSDSSGICTVLLPDVVVMCFALNAQNIRGAVDVARSVDRSEIRPIRLMPVPMRVEDAERERLNVGRHHAREAFAPYLGWVPEDLKERYWGDVEIPYKAYYAYEEIPATVGDGPHQTGTVLRASERLTKWITQGAVSGQQPLPSDERQRLLNAYLRKSRVVADCLFISYAPHERIWAEWAAAHLQEAGFNVSLQSAARPAEDDLTPSEAVRAQAGEGRIVALLSGDYSRRPRAGAIFWATAVRETDSNSALVSVRVRAGDGPFAAPFDVLPVLNLAGLTAEDAALALITAVGPAPAARAGAPNPQSHVSAAGLPRFPGSAPDVEDLPSRNGGFTGRDLLLEDLRDRFTQSGGTPQKQVLVGLGGVGKTQVALEYAHRYRESYEVVWWIDAAEPSVIAAELAGLAPELGIEHGDTASTARSVLRALRRGSPHRNWLLVFDSAGPPETTNDWLPSASFPGGHVLITSRDRTWAKHGNLVEVDVFTREESVELLRRTNPALSPEDAAAVAHELGDLPLAVGQAAVWLRASAMPVDHYLDLLRTHMTEILERTRPNDQPHSVAAASWLLSMGQMRGHSPAAADLLEICSFFGSDPIPMDLLYSTAVKDALSLAPAEPRDALTISRIFRDINRFGLAKADQGEGTVTVHRLVQAEIRESLPQERRLKLRAVVHAALADCDPKHPAAPDNWPRYDRLLPHLWPSRAERSSVREVRQWIINSVRCLWRRSLFTAARDTAKRVLDEWTTRFDDDDVQVLNLRTQLSNALRSQGDFQGAYLTDLDVHTRFVRTLGEEHPHTLVAAANLGADLNALGQYREARDLDRKTLRASKRVWGSDYLRTTMHASNLGVSEYLCGDRRAALEIHKKLYEDRIADKGRDDIYTLNAGANYARDLRETGDIDSALEILQETCRILWQRVGRLNVQTLAAQRNHAVALRRAGRYEEARELVEAVHRICAENLGRDHPDTLAALIDLASVRAALGDIDAALEHSLRALARQRETLGDEHPYTLSSANNLSIYLRLSGRHAEARELSGQTSQALRRVLGPTHPYAFGGMLNHASDLVAAGELEEAIALEREALRGLRASLGPDHYDTIGVCSNLALDLRASGEAQEAEQLHQEALELARRTLGSGHPTYLAVEGWQRLDSDIEPPFT